jgi:hypothetical protein
MTSLRSSWTGNTEPSMYLRSETMGSGVPSRSQRFKSMAGSPKVATFGRQSSSQTRQGRKYPFAVAIALWAVDRNELATKIGAFMLAVISNLQCFPSSCSETQEGVRPLSHRHPEVDLVRTVVCGLLGKFASNRSPVLCRKDVKFAQLTTLFLTVEPIIADIPATKSHIPAILGLLVSEEYYGSSRKAARWTPKEQQNSKSWWIVRIQ